MDDPAEEARPVPLRLRDRAQRRLIRRVTEELAQSTGRRETFGRLVRVVHLTALTDLPMGVDGALAERRLLRACQARLQAEQTTLRRRTAA